MVRANLGLALALAALSATGCGSSYSATLSGVTPMPDGSSLGATGGRLHTGIATAFTPLVTMHDALGTHDETDAIVVTSSNPGVVEVGSVSSGSQGYASGGTSADGSGGRWVVWAVAPGEATLTVTQGGNVAASLPVVVRDP